MSAAPDTGRAVIVDLPHGPADDPQDRAGLAALAARHLMDPRAGGPGTLARARVWHTRHQLAPHCSSFAFWSGLDDDLAEVGTAFALAVPPGADRLRELVAAQLRLATAYRDDPYTRLLDLLEATATGAPDRPALGTEQSLAAIGPQDVRAYLAANCGDRAVTHRSAGDDAPAPAPGAVRQPRPRHWRGGRRTVPLPGAVVRVALALPVDPPAPGALELAVELLGSHGLGGRLARALRGERPLAYGLGAFRLGGPDGRGTAALAVQAQVAPDHAREALHLLRETVHSVLSGPVPEAERRDASARLRTALLSQVDQPFGAVDERRRRLRGEPELTALAAAVGERALDGLLPSVAPGLTPATVALGAVPEDFLESGTWA
ncbi:insulinase family protein [Kitasatospora sp. NPDC098652]|uniref:insulinase family protein n=1 Tax=Kitasatospora sp. NPDC098652 TaxID=3364095 RepID=UPI0038027CFC